MMDDGAGNAAGGRFARGLIRLAGDPQRCFATRNDLHRARWTSCYPLSATLAVGTLLRQARRTQSRVTAGATIVSASPDATSRGEEKPVVGTGGGGSGCSPRSGGVIDLPLDVTCVTVRSRG